MAFYTRYQFFVLKDSPLHAGNLAEVTILIHLANSKIYLSINLPAELGKIKYWHHNIVEHIAYTKPNLQIRSSILLNQPQQDPRSFQPLSI